MAVNREAQLVRKFVEFSKLLNVYLNHFPRHERYALSNRIRNAAYDVYDLIVEGQKRYHKDVLTQLDISLSNCGCSCFWPMKWAISSSRTGAPKGRGRSRSEALAGDKQAGG